MKSDRRKNAVVGLLALVGVGVAIARTGSRGPRPGPPASPVPRDGSAMAADLAALLRTQGALTAPVELRGEDIALLGGRIRLSVADRRDPDSHAVAAHYHVVARPAGASPAVLDACILGVGTDERTKRESAASTYASLALPPLLSRFTAESRVEAGRFHGSEAWSVPGRRGSLGRIGVRGADVEAFEELSLFTDLPGLPRDGRMHLLKALLASEGGRWKRTVEIDGETPLVSGEPWSRIPAPAGTSIVVQFAVIEGLDARPDEGARDEALRTLAAKPAWLFPATACPSDVMPRELPELLQSQEACLGGRLRDCLFECERGDAASCCSAAVEVQSRKQDEAASEALFLRGCRLGSASACTNAAAGRAKADKRVDDCGLRTFEGACERGGDPWACTMLGAELTRGESARRDPATARRVLAKSCSHQADDPACAAAKALLKEIDAKP